MSGRFEEPFPLTRMVRHPVFWGMVASLAVAALAVWLGVQEDCGITGSCETRFDQVMASKPHEIGMTVGGFAMVLVVVWLVVLAWVQSRVVKLLRMGLEAKDGD